MEKVRSFRDLYVYRELCALHLEVHTLSLGFPRIERFELGSQIRRSSNAVPAILAEGWGSRHTNIYLEAINRALGELRETQHHLDIARAKNYLAAEEFAALDDRYDQCGRMLESLHQSLASWRNSTRVGGSLREETAPYAVSETDDGWEATAAFSVHALDKPAPSQPDPPTTSPQ